MRTPDNSRRSLLLAALLGGAMGGAAYAARAAKPDKLLADLRSDLELENLIPIRFGSWTQVNSERVIQADPVVNAALERFYSDTLSRTFMDTEGYAVMLSIAYGAVQTDEMRVHSPEICYPAQGFAVTSKAKAAIQVGPGSLIPVRQLRTEAPGRVEPVTYWITIGDKIVFSNIDRKLEQFRYALKGLIPDGLLFRVSSIDSDVHRAFPKQREFCADLFSALPQESRTRLFGERG